MIDLKQLESVVERITAVLPEDARVLRDEFKANLRPLLEGLLERLELVTREEFDAQTRVLERTRAKHEALEREVDRLEREPLQN